MKSWNWIERLLFLAFLIWSAAGLTFIALHITPHTIAGWSISLGLRTFILDCLAWGDPILILLAFANTHLHAARQWSGGVARRWALVILICSYAVEYLGCHTGFPFGAYLYTANFGPMAGSVPLAIPLAWHVVVTNSLFIVRAVAPHVSQLVEALLVGALCTAYDFILEPFATTVKGYWHWRGGDVPPLNYIAWFVVSVALVRLLAPTLSTRFRRDPRPWLILALTLAIFLVA